MVHTRPFFRLLLLWCASIHYLLTLFMLRVLIVLFLHCVSFLVPAFALCLPLSLVLATPTNLFASVLFVFVSSSSFFVCWVYFHTSDTLAVGAQPLNGCKQSKHMLHADKKQSSSRATRQRTRGQEDIKAGSLWWWWRWGHSEPQMVDSYTSPWSVEMVVVVTASDAKSMTFALGSSSQSSCTCLDGDDCDGCCCCCC